MRYFYHSTNDVQSHTSSIDNWQQEYYQITSGKLVCELNYIDLKNLSIYKESFNQGIAQYGCVPKGYIGVALVSKENNLKKISTVQGVSFIQEKFYIIGQGKEFITHIDKDTETIVYVLPLNYLENFFSDIFPEIFNQKKLLDNISIINLNNYHNIIQITNHIYSSMYNKINIKNLEEILIESLLVEISNHLNEQPYNFRDRVWCDIVKKSKQLIYEEGVVNISDICYKLKISRRSLQLAFNHVTDQSPLDYLRAIKLGHVRNQIIQNPTVLIGDIAYNYGFFHLGRFSNYYKMLFDELPSETKRLF